MPVSELKSYAPIAIDPNRPPAPIGAFQRMQLESWNVHVPNDLGGLQGNQQHPQSFRVLGLDPAEAAGFVKSPQPLVAKRLNH